jgi:hypothetical protein
MHCCRQIAGNLNPHADACTEDLNEQQWEAMGTCFLSISSQLLDQWEFGMCSSALLQSTAAPQGSRVWSGSTLRMRMVGQYTLLQSSPKSVTSAGTLRIRMIGSWRAAAMACMAGSPAASSAAQ